MGKTTKPNNSLKSIEKLTKIQNYSGAIFSAYALYHLIGHSLSFYSVQLANNFLLFGRKYYQNPIGELLLILLPVTIHAISGFSKRYLILKNSKGKSVFDTLKGFFSLQQLPILTGYFATFLVGLHFIGARIQPILDPSKQVDLISMIKLREEFGATFLFAYLSLLSGNTAYHLTTGLQKVAGINRNNILARTVSFGSFGAALALSYKLSYGV